MENSYLKIENSSEGNLVVPNSKIQGLNLEEIGPLCPKCGGIKTKKNKGKSVSVPNTPLQTNKNILNVTEEGKKSSANGAQIFPIDPKNSGTVNKNDNTVLPQNSLPLNLLFPRFKVSYLFLNSSQVTGFLYYIHHNDTANWKEKPNVFNSGIRR